MNSSLAHAVAAQSKYSGADDLGISTGRPVSVWTSGNETRIRIYDVKTLDATEACKYGGYMMDRLSTGRDIDADLAKIMLSLAVSMKNPDDLRTFLLSAPKRDKQYLMEHKLKAVTVTNDGGAEDPSEAEALARLAAVNASDEVQEQVNNAQNGTPHKDERDFNEDVKASFFSFVAGYMLRIQTRQVDNVYANYSKSRERFAGWYDEGAIMFEDWDVQKDSITKLKAVMTRKPEITGTWVMWLANTENEVELNKQPRGLLEYIGLQIFAYQGLHIMNQLLHLKALSKAPMGMLLRQLDCPVTRDGVREVYNIIMNLEVTTKAPNRKTYFRYARVWNDGYFTQIRSQTCAPLLYTVAKVVKEIDTDSKSDPTQIYAIQNIGAALKVRLDEAATKLTEMLITQTTQDIESGDIWQSTE
ncbi:nucleocapsid protein [Chelidonium yellow mottle associated virus]